MKPVDVIVGLLAFTISAIMLASIADVILTDTSMTDAQSERFTLIMGSLISIVSLYVGAKIQKRTEDEEKDYE